MSDRAVSASSAQRRRHHGFERSEPGTKNVVLSRTTSGQGPLRTFFYLLREQLLVCWLGIIRDLRTALLKDPIPSDVVKELLAA